ncbi:hypothetical protein [Conexibacter sp. DBS9H8]|uniref:hypothetical protein n=1 Tax=Conexibacter sp. DBS9H8 TaxID=2937801 RepID=UPI00200C99A8|nr:hypothetical protein [Conexibacter sp. DBS9H8]
MTTPATVSTGPDRGHDFHAITTPRRELSCWAAVLCTFALGTAAGDLTADALGWGFWSSALLFTGVIARPLGASFADGFSTSGNGGLNLGDPLVALCALAVLSSPSPG